MSKNTRARVRALVDYVKSPKAVRHLQQLEGVIYGEQSRQPRSTPKKMKLSAGRPARPGEDGAVLWALVRNVMDRHNVDHKQAVRWLLAHGYKDRALAVRNEGKRNDKGNPLDGKVKERWIKDDYKKRSLSTLARKYRAADKRYETDAAFRAECEWWRPRCAAMVAAEAEGRQIQLDDLP